MLPGQDCTAADIGTCKSRSADWSRPIDTVDHEILLQRLALILSKMARLSTVCENWSATVHCYPARGQYPTKVSTGSGPILFSHQMTKSLLCQLHWLSVQHQITYKLVVLAYKVQTKSMTAYLSCHIKLCDTVWTLRLPTTN